MQGKRPEENLTGGQIQQILDKILYDCVYVVLPFGLFDDLVVNILSSSVLDRRRKISNADYDHSINLMCSIVLRNSDDLFDDMRQLKLERTAYLKKLNFLVEKVEESNYVQLYNKWLTKRSKSLEEKLRKVEDLLNIDRGSLYSVYQNVKMNLTIFMEFKTSIVSQFINLAHKYTSTQIKHKNKNLNYDDLFQNIISAVSKAIDKYDSSKGALTSYVKYWIINAQNQDNSHIDGLAYEITNNQRQKVARKEVADVNFSSSLSEAQHVVQENSSPEEILEEKDSMQRMLYLVKSADVDGIFRLTNNIDEYFSEDELNKMKDSMENEIKKYKLN